MSETIKSKNIFFESNFIMIKYLVKVKICKFLLILKIVYLFPVYSFADPLKDLEVSNKVTSHYNAGDLKKVENSINDFSNEQLKEVWISNLLLKYYAKNDLKEVVRLYPKLNDNNLQQLWVSNILIKALSLKKCKIGKSFIDKLENDNLRKVWKVNYLNC